MDIARKDHESCHGEKYFLHEKEKICFVTKYFVENNLSKLLSYSKFLWQCLFKICKKNPRLF